MAHACTVCTERHRDDKRRVVFNGWTPPRMRHASLFHSVHRLGAKLVTTRLLTPVPKLDLGCRIPRSVDARIPQDLYSARHGGTSADKQQGKSTGLRDTGLRELKRVGKCVRKLAGMLWCGLTAWKSWNAGVGEWVGKR